MNFKCKLGFHKHPFDPDNPPDLNTPQQITFYCERCNGELESVAILRGCVMNTGPFYRTSNFQKYLDQYEEQLQTNQLESTENPHIKIEKIYKPKIKPPVA